MTEAPGTHNPQFLPPGIPVPQDDGAARHLAGAKITDVALPATEGAPVNLSKLKGRTVVYIYPRTGVPGVDPPDGWDQIPGARG
ncbi:MAG TPA: peroxiredoxin, partial [Pseudolabrys sp.]|nr:peroxiredoxin [Pseudolabrys sp.]